MKTGKLILEEYVTQSTDTETFKTLTELIDNNTIAAIEAVVSMCETTSPVMWRSATRKLERGLK